MSRALALLLAAAAAAPAAGRAHRVPEAFEARLPVSWAPRDGWSGPYPVFAFQRAGAGAVNSIERYANGNGLYPSAKAFLSASARGGDAPARRVGWVIVGGRRLPLFERSYKEPSGDPSPGKPSEPVERQERYLAVPARNHFIVLRLKAEPAAFAASAEEFAAFVASFRLLAR